MPNGLDDDFIIRIQVQNNIPALSERDEPLSVSFGQPVNAQSSLGCFLQGPQPVTYRLNCMRSGVFAFRGEKIVQS